MRTALFSLLGIGAIVASIWLTASVWDECRDEGHSFFYCLRLVSK